METISNVSSAEKNPLMVPTLEEWEKMTLFEQQKVEERVIEALDSQTEFMGETTNHFDVRVYATLLLRRFYQEQEREIFIASDLYTLYPGEEAFYPDLLVVFDSPNHPRTSWIVANEKKGFDFVLEVLSKSTWENDLVKKINLYARLGIPEYFIYNPENFDLKGYRLANGIYREIPQEEKGIFSSQLQLYLKNDDVLLRFSTKEGVPIPFAEEIIRDLNSKLAKKGERIIAMSEERDRIAEERDQEKERADQKDEKLKEAEAEIQRLKELLGKSPT